MLYANVMHIDRHKFLISIVEPLQITVQVQLENEMADQLGLALQGHISILRARGFQPSVVYIDPQSGCRTLKNMFPGVLLDEGGAADYIPKVDSIIRRVKELYRAVKHGLPWKLPIALVKPLVCYMVGHLILHRTSSLASTMSPYMLFKGKRVNYKKSLALAFGDYAEVFDGSNNTSRSQSMPCVALHPCKNSTGSWEFLNLTTGNRIRRSNWKKMVTTKAIIDKLNSMTSVSIPEEVPDQPDARELLEVPETSETQEGQIDQPVEEDHPQEAEQNETMNAAEAEEEQHEAEVIPVRWSSRIARGIVPPQ